MRWLNAHEVTIDEITEGMTEEEIKVAKLDGLNKRRLIVEFAVENAQVVKRRREREIISKKFDREKDKDGNDKKRKRNDKEEEEQGGNRSKKQRHGKGPLRKGNMNKGAKPQETKLEKEPKNKSGLSDNIKSIIGQKRMRRKGKK